MALMYSGDSTAYGGAGNGSGYGDGAGYGYGSGYGDGAGYGYGYGYGYGDGDGDGSGSGDGYGYGSGSGSGDGYGYGYGYGSGDGDGDGDGDGYGSGSGSGSGDGYGDGYGYGSGYGDGDGLESKEYLTAYLEHIGGDAAKAAIANGAMLAVWRSNKDGRPANGGSGESAHPGKVNTEKGPLNLCGKGTLHATLTPNKWAGDRFWCVAMYPPFEEQEDKIGSLKREIICEIPELYKQHT